MSISMYTHVTSQLLNFSLYNVYFTAFITLFIKTVHTNINLINLKSNCHYFTNINKMDYAYTAVSSHTPSVSTIEC